MSDIPRLVAIDPGASVGVAALTADGTLLAVATYSWTRRRENLLAWLSTARQLGAVVAVVEQPPAGVYPRPGLTRQAMLRVARSVGQCQERAAELALACSQMGYEVLQRRPIRRGTKLPRATWDAMFPNFAGRRISGHARDAAVLGKCSLGMEGRG